MLVSIRSLKELDGQVGNVRNIAMAENTGMCASLCACFCVSVVYTCVPVCVMRANNSSW